MIVIALHMLPSKTVEMKKTALQAYIQISWQNNTAGYY